MSVFNFVNAINGSKVDLIKTGEMAESDYVPFVVNRALSYFPETLLYANEMNKHAELPGSLQFSYYLNTIRPAKRYAKWIKRGNAEDVEIVRQAYGYNTEKALQALTILTETDIRHIKEKLERGGNDGTKDPGRDQAESG